MGPPDWNRFMQDGKLSISGDESKEELAGGILKRQRHQTGTSESRDARREQKPKINEPSNRENRRVWQQFEKSQIKNTRGL